MDFTKEHVPVEPPLPCKYTKKGNGLQNPAGDNTGEPLWCLNARSIFRKKVSQETRATTIVPVGHTATDRY